VLKLKEEDKGREIQPREGRLGTKLTAIVFSIIYELEDPGFNSRHRRNTDLFSETSSLALEPTQSPLQRIEGFFHGGKVKGRDAKLATSLHPHQRLRMSGAIPFLPPSAFMVYTRTNAPLPLAN
jgi:hypothetical protein